MTRPNTLALLAGLSPGLNPHAGDDFPPFADISNHFTAVPAPADGTTPLWNLRRRDKDAQLLAELPAIYDNQRFYIVPTIASADSQLGVDSTWHPAINQDARALYWTRRNNLMVLIQPNLAFRSAGDAESHDALTVPELFTSVRNQIWSELTSRELGRASTDRNPAISSLRRHLQAQHARRHIELATGLRWPGSAASSVTAISREELRTLQAAIAPLRERPLDTATRAHLNDMHQRIQQALAANYLRRD